METHYHRGGATVAFLTLGIYSNNFSHIHARVATSIECGDADEITFTTN